MMVFLTSGCAHENTPTPDEVSVPPIEPVSTMPTPEEFWFPENLRQLSASEKNTIIEIVLNTPEASEWLQKESKYEISFDWAALYPDSSGTGYSGYMRYEYEIVETGIPVYPRGRAVLDPRDAEKIYPDVTIRFGEPGKWIVSAAVDLEACKVVFVEGYPFRTPPIRPAK
ncbi:MAG: hypothetical protein Q8Q07_02950 [Dehalococcoidales bacterium]|nr:hypothetical protein [Dehalococcoidales bacterium]